MFFSNQISCKIASDKFLGIRSNDGEILYNAVDTEKFIPKLKKSRNIFKITSYR